MSVGSPAAPRPQSASHGASAAGRWQGSPASRPGPARPRPRPGLPVRGGGSTRGLGARLGVSPGGEWPPRPRQSTEVLPPSPCSQSRGGVCGLPEDTGLSRPTGPWPQRGWCRSGPCPQPLRGVMGIFIIINGSMFALRLDYSPIVQGSTQTRSETVCTRGNRQSRQKEAAERARRKETQLMGRKRVVSPGSPNRPVAENRLSRLLQVPSSFGLHSPLV